MATIRLHDNIFENNYKDFDYDSSKSLMNQLEEMSNAQSNVMVECYDCETGETFFEPLVDEEGNQSVIISVNNKIVDADYKVQSDDIVEVVFIPMAKGGISRTWSGIIGGYVGSIVGGLATAALFVGTAAVGVAMTPVLAVLVGSAFIAGGIYLGTRTAMSLWDKSNGTSSVTSKNGESLPDVRNAENQAITNNPFPFVIGKHLCTPFIIGSPFVHYSGNYGEDAYLKVLYCVGYGPLKITDIKLGDLLLAYNRTSGVVRNTVMRGILKGASENGDISTLWSNNDIQLEIIQNKKGEKNYSTIYSASVKQSEVGAIVSFIADKSVAQLARVVYKGTSYPNHFRSNTIRLTEKYPRSFSVVLDFENGLYSSYSQTKDSNTESKYGKINLCFAIQWRVARKTNPAAETDGTDYNLWHTLDKVDGSKGSIGATYNASLLEADFMGHFGNDISYSTTSKVGKVYYNPKKSTTPVADVLDLLSTYRREAMNSSGYMKFNSDGTLSLGGIKIDGIKFNEDNLEETSYTNNYYMCNFVSTNQASSFPTGALYDINTKTLYLGLHIKNRSSNEVDFNIASDFIVYEDANNVSLTVYNYTQLKNAKKSVATGSTSIQVKRLAVCGEMFEKKSQTYNETAEFWVGKQVVNFKDWSGEDHLSQMRATATVDLSNYPSDYKDLLDDSICPSHCIEVRVIRISPNYLNQTTVTESQKNKNEGPFSYTDSVKWSLLTSYISDNEDYESTRNISFLKSIREEDVEPFSYIALSVKADTSGNIEGSINKLNCMVESFSPYWDKEKHKWFPENVTKEAKYYGYYTSSYKTQKCNRSSTAYEAEVTEEQYNTARQEGYSWIKKECGTDYFETISKEAIVTTVDSNKQFADGSTIDDSSITYEASDNKFILKKNGVACALLPPSAERYNDNNFASGFLLGCVGPQNGPDAKEYSDIDLLSVADAYMFAEDVKDGSTYSRDTYINGVKHSAGEEVSFRMECNAYVYQQKKVEEIIANIAATGRSSYTYDDYGKIKLIVDNKVDYPKGILSQQNIISRSDTYSFSDDFAGYLVTHPDEDDGYEQSSFYCWADGNTLKNYKGKVESVQFPMVTNSNQAWSLARYAIANKVLNKNVITVKVGVDGNDYKLGDVFVVQEDNLYLTETSARIQEVLIKNNQVVGFITDGVYEYTGEEEDNLCIQGVSILQPKKFNDNRIVTLRIAKSGTKVTVNNIQYKMTVGLTNVVLLDTPVSLDSDVTNMISKYNFSTGDTVLFGEVDVENERYRIIKIKPEGSGYKTLTMLPYYDEVYSYGRQLPYRFSSVRKRDAIKDITVVNDIPKTIAEDNTKTDANNNYISNTISEDIESKVKNIVVHAPSSLLLPSDSEGNNVDYSTATASVSVYDGSVDVTSQCTFSILSTSAVKGTFTSNTFTITQLNSDSDLFKFNAVYNDNEYLCQISVSKVKQGLQGLAGSGFLVDLSEESFAIPIKNCESDQYIETTVSLFRDSVNHSTDSGVTYSATLNDKTLSTSYWTNNVLKVPCSELDTEKINTINITVTYDLTISGVRYQGSLPAQATVSVIPAAESTVIYSMITSASAVAKSNQSVLNPSELKVDKMKTNAHGPSDTEYGYITAEYNDDGVQHDVDRYNNQAAESYDKDATYYTLSEPLYIDTGTKDDNNEPIVLAIEVTEDNTIVAGVIYS